jgi:hypothetical protein
MGWRVFTQQLFSPSSCLLLLHGSLSYRLFLFFELGLFLRLSGLEFAVRKLG